MVDIPGLDKTVCIGTSCRDVGLNVDSEAYRWKGELSRDPTEVETFLVSTTTLFHPATEPSM